MKSVKQQDVQVIRCIHCPSDVIRHTLQATFLLLGHSQADLTYVKIRSMLKSRGPDTIMARMDNLSADSVSREAALGAQELCHKYSIEAVCKACCAATGFFVWNQSMIEAVLEQSGDVA